MNTLSQAKETEQDFNLFLKVVDLLTIDTGSYKSNRQLDFAIIVLVYNGPYHNNVIHGFMWDVSKKKKSNVFEIL